MLKMNEIYLTSFCDVLNKTPRIMFSARNREKFKTYFTDRVTPETLASFGEIKGDVDFLCGVKDLKQPILTWGTIATKKTDMAYRSIMSFDLDWNKNEGLNQKEVTARALLATNIWLVVNSGHGLHLHYALETPVPLVGETDFQRWDTIYRLKSQDLIEYLQILEFDLGAAQPARTMRLPVSKNYKDPENPIPTEILAIYPDARLDVQKDWEAVGINPLQAPKFKNDRTDDLKQKVLDAFSWPLVFNSLGIPWNPKSQGSDYLVCSPFRTDKKPSMTLSVDKKVFYDFGDPTSKGDIVHFWATHSGLTYGEALIEMARGAGITKEKFTLIKNNRVFTESESEATGTNGQTITQSAPVDEVAAMRNKKKPKQACYADYERMFDDYFGRTEKDLFSNELVYKPEGSNRWTPCASNTNLQTLKGIVANGDGSMTMSLVQVYLEGIYHNDHQGSKRQPKFLVDVPVWDGVDRIEEVVNCLPITNVGFVTAYELVKEWCGNLWARIDAPLKQNKILIIKGPQGAGKDYLIEHLFRALGQYKVQFSICQQEKDTFDILSSGILMHISEYDRTNKADVSTLKHIITSPEGVWRGSYERKAEHHYFRASFIATTNDNKILKDPTGFRRYIYLELGDKIKRGYDIDSLQFLAQCKHLAETAFESSKEANEEMESRLEVLRPEDWDQVVIEDWLIETSGKQWLNLALSGSEALPHIEKLAKLHGVGVLAIRSVLKRNKYSKRVAEGVVYSTRDPFGKNGM